VVLSASFNLEVVESEDAFELSPTSVTSSAAMTAKEIVAKLNEQLKDKLPEGIESLSAEDVTSDATAERIVTGITALFEGYAKSNPELDPEEILTRFLDAARSGVTQGYDDAFEILEGLGAFEIDGVRDGVEKTRSLIEEKLLAFEDKKRIELALPSRTDSITEETRHSTTSEIITQAGGRLALAA
jgi:Domain of unknown function (DUF5610)